MEMMPSGMVNDKMTPWFMQVTQAVDAIAIVKGEKEATHDTADHMPVQIPNTIAKVGDKTVLLLF